MKSEWQVRFMSVLLKLYPQLKKKKKKLHFASPQEHSACGNVKIDLLPLKLHAVPD